MSEQDWTPGPWQAGDDSRHMPLTSIMAGDRPVALAISAHPDDREETEANAHRIVAAVNACAGIPTEILEHLNFANTADRIREARLAEAERLLRRCEAFMAPEAVTIDEPICGFQGWRYRWWQREDEKPFPDWQTP